MPKLHALIHHMLISNKNQVYYTERVINCVLVHTETASMEVVNINQGGIKIPTNSYVGVIEITEKKD